jgi:hypothetical protein
MPQGREAMVIMVAIVVWTMMMATMGMIVGMVPMRFIVLVLVPRLRPIRLNGRI